MSKVRFRQADLQRALRAAKVEGIAVERYEIEPETGKIIIITRNAEGAGSASTPLDNWLAKHARAS
jgi:hypothetical protein